jgi:predicted TIM-barrel fold metal-dependent hydrolase
MIIDSHGHVTTPETLYSYKANLLAHRGAHGRGRVGASDDDIRAAVIDEVNPAFGMSHMAHLDEAGIDLQVISPRPFHMMHSEEPAKIVQWYIEENNDLIHRCCELFPDRFVAMCGLPQSPTTDPTDWIPEMRRCVEELGFVGVLLNSDPTEGQGPPPPPMGDRYWYPVYEALCELGVPALIHSAGCRPPAREDYSLHFIIEETISVASLLKSSVRHDFPELKLIVSHAGGAIPYQIGRFISNASREPNSEPYLERMRSLYFDTCLYTQDAIELLIKTVGADRCLFGSEKPGTGSTRNPDNGRWWDDVKLLIEDIDWLDDSDRKMIFEDTARTLFRLDERAPQAVANRG